jgi:predicted dehydrogenase
MGLVHSCVLNVLPDVQIVGVCEKSGLIRRFAKKLFKGVQVVDDVEKLAGLGLDAAFVTTPIPSHFAVTQALYSSKIVRNVFVEKTLSQNFEQAIELVELARKFGGVNMVGYLRRFYVTFQKAKDLLSQGAIGDPSSFEAYAYSADFCGAKEVSPVLASRGGVLRDLGCYAIDLALWFFGELDLSGGETSSSYYEKDGSVDFGLKNAKGLTGSLKVSPYMPDFRMPEVGFVIKGSDGEIVVNDDRVELRQAGAEVVVWYRHDLSDNVPFCLGLPEYYREDLLFVNSVVSGHSAAPDFSSAARVDDLISQIERAGKKDD